MNSVTLFRDIRGAEIIWAPRLSRLGRMLRKPFRAIHAAVAAAKLRRLRNELLLRRSSVARIEADISRRPQVPLILRDKWDF
ncbi:hypothetical protein [Bradyrhizobium sp. SRS-191]|uniref:hypothetical protein n=1 Tax=Bradyrhizobium sp. SRS-191 TaxID=2962606 RepID=UPI00211EBBC3|nr:hypothetical protein [Bradyrhizobium sp. SRS-191]